VALGIARAMLSEFITLASHKAPRGLRLADNPVMQADLARAKARLGSASAYLIDTLTMRRTDDVAPIDVTNRARVRLACANAIPGAVELGDSARERASTRSSRAVRSSSASATCTRFISRSRHAPTILLWKQSHTHSENPTARSQS
jgi:alkylation response protein AidB-like acyl-CoA dehydrogenase